MNVKVAFGACSGLLRMIQQVIYTHSLQDQSKCVALQERLGNVAWMHKINAGMGSMFPKKQGPVLMGWHATRHQEWDDNLSFGPNAIEWDDNHPA